MINPDQLTLLSTVINPDQLTLLSTVINPDLLTFVIGGDKSQDVFMSQHDSLVDLSLTEP